MRGETGLKRGEADELTNGRCAGGAEPGGMSRPHHTHRAGRGKQETQGTRETQGTSLKAQP